MKSVIIIGNGRSLKEYNFKNIYRDRYDIVGLGLAFRYWERIDWYPDVYVNIDKVVCEKNKSVAAFIKKNKCSKYIVSETIKNIWTDYPTDGSILFFEDLKKDPSSIYHDVIHYGSGNIAAYYGIDNYSHVKLIGFDCDYVETIPECDIAEDKETLIIKETPIFNPNYFFDSYQQQGDIYNLPNGKQVHLNSWIELSKKDFPNTTIINYNDKKSLYHLFESYPLQQISFDYPEYNPNKKIAFCVPSTSKTKDWKCIQHTYLYCILLESLRPLQRDYQVTVYIGYDDDDELYSKINLPEYFNHIKLQWYPQKNKQGDPCAIWTGLAKTAIEEGHEYFKICGDDIQFDNRSEWLPVFIKQLKKNNNIGYVAGYSNNDMIPTQFLFHKTHVDLFGWVYPPQIKNWYCDNFIYDLYGKQYGNWLINWKHYNLGGEPRYRPNNDKRLCKMLVKKYKSIIRGLP